MSDAKLSPRVGSPTGSGTGYPWSPGDPLYAQDLNYAIANAVTLSGALQTSGGTMTGPLILMDGSPAVSQAGSQTAGDARYLQLATGGTLHGPLTLLDGSPAVSQSTGDGRYLRLIGGTVVGATTFSSTGTGLSVSGATTLTGPVTFGSPVTLPAGSTGPWLALAGGTVTGDVTLSSTGKLKLVTGTTAQRNVTSVQGDIRYNTTNNQIELAEANAAIPLPVAGRIVRVPTIAALRSFDITGFTASTQCIAMVDGYTTAGDAGGGIFDWDAGAGSQVTSTGNTYSTTTIDNLSATIDLFPGMVVAGPGIPTNATIATLVSITSITISAAATASATGVSLTFYRRDEGVVRIKPTSLGFTGTGMWTRRLNGNFITPEMAGAVGDYQFPQAGIGEVIGTDNTAAFNRFANAANFTSGPNTVGLTMVLPTFKTYRIAGVVTLASGTCIDGQGRISESPTPAGTVTKNLQLTGGTIVIDSSAGGKFVLGARHLIRNIRIIARGVDMNPTTAQVISWWTQQQQSMAPSMCWAATTAYAVGAIIANVGLVYKCTTAGTSAASYIGGPFTPQVAITDGTVVWQYIGQLQWTVSTAYQVGQVMNCRENVYVCDTAGTSAASGFGPTSTSTGANSVVDGTARWHYVSSFSVGIISTQGASTIERCEIYGFAVGLLAQAAVYELRSCYFDNFTNVDTSGSGDTCILDRIHCIPLYAPTADTPANSDWEYKAGVSLMLRDHMDTAIVKDYESLAWAVGIRLSNVWGVNVRSPRIEGTRDWWAAAGIQLCNICAFIELTEVYSSSPIALDCWATDQAHSLPYTAAQGASSVLVRGGQWGTAASSAVLGAGYNPTHFRIGGKAAGQIANAGINMQGFAPFTFMPGDGTGGKWAISDMRVDNASNDTPLTAMCIIDPSMVGNVHFAGIFHSDESAWSAPPGADDTIDLVAAPVSAGTHTIHNSLYWCHLTPAATLASYTVTLPANPYDKQQILISSTQAITAFTVSPNTGQTITTAPTSMPKDGTYRFRYLAASSQWVRLAMEVGSVGALPLTGGTVTGTTQFQSGLNFGSTLASSTTDLTKHIALYGTTYGIDVTGSRVNYVSSNAHVFIAGTTDQMQVQAGVMTFLNTTSNFIAFGQNGIAPPSFTTRSAGAKIGVFSVMSATQCDMGFGVETSGMWTGVRQTSDHFSWYGGTTLAATMTGTGNLSMVGGLGLFGTTAPTTKGTVSGACAGNTAIKALLTFLAGLGMLTDSTTA